MDRYREVCGLEKKERLPLLFPHVCSQGLHMAMLTHKSFPIKLLGSVHLRNHILAHRAISVSETLALVCRLGEFRIMEKGMEFDFTTLVHVDDERVWESVSTYYVRGRFGEQGTPSPLAKMPEITKETPVSEWHVAADLGKKYAPITGDYNPIHMSKMLAKLFGFKRDIAHGFCVLATCLEQFGSNLVEGACRFDAAFKGPVFLDSQVVLKASAEGDSGRFNLYCDENERPSICGLVQPAKPGENLV
ncbi:MaoC/PaaZ C-terminal domain-containing protein [Acanthopleuribacter pedis]|uniref:MaoC-like domain-containing protein n=1 Tax=Acanthopleuribacter pedis TaxID=442870 RepID=A0A8J7Q897_9BACT|nr:MaoC/PaaZ C-terminal domain-containing protein [Acanthopleuribacter pedis]MBO1318709.1 hypothetical protein [Acanthopleuribacter pedis]